MEFEELKRVRTQVKSTSNISCHLSSEGKSKYCVLKNTRPSKKWDVKSCCVYKAMFFRAKSFKATEGNKIPVS